MLLMRHCCFRIIAAAFTAVVDTSVPATVGDIAFTFRNISDIAAVPVLAGVPAIAFIPAVSGVPTVSDNPAAAGVRDCWGVVAGIPALAVGASSWRPYSCCLHQCESRLLMLYMNQ
jgi:hypothetical protein